MAAGSAGGDRKMIRICTVGFAKLADLACVLAIITAGSLAAEPSTEAAPQATVNPTAAPPTTPVEGSTAAVAGVAAPRCWELSPYRIQLFVHVDSAAGWRESRRHEFAAAVRSRTASLIGGIWQLTVGEAPATFPWDQAAQPSAIPAESLPTATRDFDKLMLLDVKPGLGTSTLSAREFDVRTQTWSPIQRRAIDAASDMTQESLRAMWSAFRLVARIESVSVQDSGTNATLRVLGGDLQAVGHGADLALGVLWQPVVCHADAAGHTLPKGVFPVPWTFMVTLHANGSTAQSAVISATSDPFDLQYNGRTEYLALAVNAASCPSTVLVVLADGSGDRPLEDLEVMSRDGDGKLRFVGRTDANGRVEVSRNVLALRTLYIRSGDVLLLRLPLMCGTEPAFTVRVEDNGRRPASARFIESASSKLIDLAAQQQVLAARLQRQLVAGKGDEAAVTFGALANLPTSGKFVATLDAQRAGLAAITADPTAAAWLDKQLANVKTLATQNLIDSATLGKLHDAVNKAK
jgi:hypothetical protein